ncbi:MAG TPA: alpha/beta hydrolase [Chitinophagales bacterium]
MKHICVFSGLGADKRVFREIDFSGFDVTFIEWIEPQNNENLTSYAKRLANQITSDKPILIGLSFGGIVATEIAKIIDTEKIILIASAQTKHNIPFYYRIAGKLRLHKLLPTTLLKHPNIFLYRVFGVNTEKDKLLLSEILCDTNPKFLTWAIDKIITWNNEEKLNNVKQIHGTADKLLPIKYADYDVKVSGGGHFMTISQADELTRIIRELISLH